MARVRIAPEGAAAAATQPTTTFTFGNLEYKFEPGLSETVLIPSSKSGAIDIGQRLSSTATTPTTIPAIKPPEMLISTSKSTRIELLPSKTPATAPAEKEPLP